MSKPLSKQNKKQVKAAPLAERYPNLLPYSILVLGALLLYGWTSSFDFNLDDNYTLSPLNSIGNSFTDVWKVFTKEFAGLDYRPVATLSFWIERKLSGGIDPHISHFINVVLFALLLITIYRLVIVSGFYENTKRLQTLALLASLLFLVHPSHVSVVANIKSRDGILSMLFGSLTAIEVLKAYDKRQWWRLLLAVGYLTLAELSKRDCYALAFYPLVVIGIYRKPKLKKFFISLFIVVMVIRITFWIRDIFHGFVDQDVVKYTFMDFSKTPLANNEVMVKKLSMACITMLYYLKFQLVPWGYYFYFGYNQIPLLPLFHPLNIAVVIIYLGIGGACLYVYKKDRIFLFSLLFFLIGIGYASNVFVIVAGIVMDRYAFIASFGFCLALSAGLIYLSGKTDKKVFSNTKVLAVLFVFAAFTVYRTSAWKDKLTLCERDLPHLDRSFNALRIASSMYEEYGLKLSYIRKPTTTEANAYMDKAREYADKAIAIYDQSAEIWKLRGICDLYDGDDMAALEKLRKCKQLDSNYFSGINYLGVAFRNLNMTDSAYYYFHYVMEKENSYSFSANNLVDLLLKNNRRSEADSMLRVLKKRFPDDPGVTKKLQEIHTPQ